MKAELRDWFGRFDDNNDGRLQRDELRALLTHLEPESPPDEATLDMLIVKATSIESSSLTIRGNKNGSVDWHAVQETVLRFRDHVREKGFLDGIFDRFDADGSGHFDKEELMPLLRSVAPQGIEVDHADAEYVLSLCDCNDNGYVDRDELQPMIARWKNILVKRETSAKQREEAQRQASSPGLLGSFRRLPTSRALPHGSAAQSSTSGLYAAGAASDAEKHNRHLQRSPDESRSFSAFLAVLFSRLMRGSADRPDRSGESSTPLVEGSEPSIQSPSRSDPSSLGTAEVVAPVNAPVPLHSSHSRGGLFGSFSSRQKRRVEPSPP